MYKVVFLLLVYVEDGLITITGENIRIGRKEDGINFVLII